MDSIFFFLSKLAWLFVAPDSFIIILFLSAWLLLLLGKNRWGLRLLTIGIGILLLVALFPVGEWLIYPLENRFPANPMLSDKIDGIIVLGGPENANLTAAWKQVEVGDAAERLFAFRALASRYPDAKRVFTGGSGSMLYQQAKGAEVAKLFFEQQGMMTSRIIFETASRNTFENAELSKRLVKPGVGEIWLLITSAYHMPRAVGLFCRIGWPTIPYPVDHYSWPGNLFRMDVDLTGHLSVLGIALREWLGLAVYYATGKTAALIPRPC